jgi:hypothetical protein
MSEIDLMRIVLPDLQPASGKEQNMVHGKTNTQYAKELIVSQESLAALAAALVAADKAAGVNRPFSDFEMLLLSQLKINQAFIRHLALGADAAQVEAAVEEFPEDPSNFPR